MLESLKQCEQLDRQFLLLLPDDAAPEVHRLFELTGLAEPDAGGRQLGGGGAQDS